MLLRVNICLFTRHQNSIGEAIGMVDKLAADAISARDCKCQLALLAETNPDIEALREAKDDPIGRRDQLQQEFDRISAILDSVGAAS